MILTKDEYESIERHENSLIVSYIMGMKISKTKFDVDRNAYGVLNHAHKLIDAFRSSEMYIDLPKRPGDSNDSSVEKI